MQALFRDLLEGDFFDKTVERNPGISAGKAAGRQVWLVPEA